MKKTISLCLLAVLMLLTSGCGLFSTPYEDEALEATESYATSAFRNEMGFALDSVESEVLYNEERVGGNQLFIIGVTCYIGDETVAKYGVHCLNSLDVDATEMLPSGYDFEENLDDLKALFGVVG